MKQGRRRGGPATRLAPLLAAWLALAGGCAEPPEGNPDSGQSPGLTALPIIPDSSFVGLWSSDSALADSLTRRRVLALMASGAAVLTVGVRGQGGSARSGSWQPTGEGGARVVLSGRGASGPETLLFTLQDRALIATVGDTLEWPRHRVRLTRTVGSR